MEKENFVMFQGIFLKVYNILYNKQLKILYVQDNEKMIKLMDMEYTYM